MKIQKNLLIGLVKSRLNILSLINPSLARKEVMRLFCTPLVRYKGKPADIFLKSEALEFKLDDLSIRGFRCNHPSLKKLLILHGFSSSCHKFEHFVKPLVKLGYEVLAFDAPAHGRSDGKQVNALVYAEMIKKIQTLYGPINAYIGHSFGGLAACFALESLQSLPATKLVLIAPAADTTTAIDNAFAMLKLRNKKLRQMMDDEILALSGNETSWFSIRRAIKNIDAEVLWIQDENDLITPMKDALKVKDDNHGHVNFCITKGLGHQKIYHDRTVMDTIINFLGK
ncbi:MAG: alpha/beta fold hydrolase [Ferruginibacter sp.]